MSSQSKRRRDLKRGVIVIFAVISVVSVIVAAVLVLINEYANEEAAVSMRVEKLNTLSDEVPAFSLRLDESLR